MASVAGGVKTFVTVRFLPSGRSAQVPAGTSLLDAAQAAGVAVPFSCRAGRCITCAVHVAEGMENLYPPDPDEAETLEIMMEPDLRLACVALVRQGTITVRVPQR